MPRLTASAWEEPLISGRILLFVAGYLGALVATVVIAIGMLATLPDTYFRDDPGRPRVSRGGATALVARIARNTLGALLIILGVVLALPGVPGQGVLTILIGLMLVDFPAKHRLERKLVARPGVLATLNRLRAWVGKPPFVL